ncbi:hypothetical protein [Kutzneria chonburiensis]|uniref:FxLD family lantipeptide n=1 Tax=Kutzneria chonburiensis TaxID=1483604 RepID=A0ABV6N778_9PSEU|nr:hypothetical protein [Kutzneria chonburiensis]
MTTVLDDFDLDIRIGDVPGRLLEMQPPSTQIGCETDSGIGCGPVRSQDICPTESCHKTGCC